MMPYLIAANMAVLALVVIVAGRYLYLMTHGYCLSLYRPD